MLTLSDPRVRVVGLTVPAPGQVLVRLQSYAEEPVACRIVPGFPVAETLAADYLGAAGAPLEPDTGGGTTVEVPTLGTAAVLLRL